MRLTEDSTALTPAAPSTRTPVAGTPALRPAALRPAPVPEPADAMLTVIEGRRTWTMADAREVWRFRELFYFLTLRDIKLRYKQTVLGVGWSVFQPLATVVVFAVFFGYMGKVSEGLSAGRYVLFVLSGVLPWTYFANATANAANSLVGNERLVTKTYFPRVFLPASNVGAATFDFAVGLVVLAVWLVVAGPAPTWRLAFAPLLVALLALASFGVGTLLSALIATQRDFRYLLTFGMQLWMFSTTAIYLPPSKYPAGLRAEILWLNPMHGLIANFRASLLGEPFEWPALAISALFTLVVVVGGLMYFRRVEHTMADTL